MYITVHRRTKLTRIFICGAIIFVLLLVLEISIGLLLNPDTFLGNGDIAHRFATLYSLLTHTLLLPLIVLLEALLVLLITRWLARPFTVLRYLYRVRKEINDKQDTQTFYFPLTALS